MNRLCMIKGIGEGDFEIDVKFDKPRSLHTKKRLNISGNFYHQLEYSHELGEHFSSSIEFDEFDNIMHYKDNCGNWYDKDKCSYPYPFRIRLATLNVAFLYAKLTSRDEFKYKLTVESNEWNSQRVKNLAIGEVLLEDGLVEIDAILYNCNNELTYQQEYMLDVLNHDKYAIDNKVYFWL